MAKKSQTQITLETVYAERKPTGHWFDVDTLHWFKSKIHPELHIDGEDHYFIESQQPPFGARQYSIRKMDIDGEITKFYDGEDSYKVTKSHFKKLKGV